MLDPGIEASQQLIDDDIKSHHRFIHLQGRNDCQLKFNGLNVYFKSLNGIH